MLVWLQVNVIVCNINSYICTSYLTDDGVCTLSSMYVNNNILEVYTCFYVVIFVCYHAFFGHDLPMPTRSQSTSASSTHISTHKQIPSCNVSTVMHSIRLVPKKMCKSEPSNASECWFRPIPCMENSQVTFRRFHVGRVSLSNNSTNKNNTAWVCTSLHLIL